MRRVLSWGLPLYAAILTVIFVTKGQTDNYLKADGDVRHSTKAVATVPTPEKSTSPTANGSQGTYPIPAPLAQPKHLVHFIIRYEGDGLADQGMLVRTMAAAGESEEDAPKKRGKSKVAKAGTPDMFQFIVRYEGDGIVDENVVKLLKEYFKSEQKSEPKACAPIAVGLPPAGLPGPLPGSPATNLSPRWLPPDSPKNSEPRKTPAENPEKKKGESSDKGETPIAPTAQ